MRRGCGRLGRDRSSGWSGCWPWRGSFAKPMRINPESLRIEHSVGPRHGMEILYAWSRLAPAPVGFVWYEQILLNQVNILYIFVHEDCRRQGMGRKMVSTLQEWYPESVLCTAKGNELSLPWLPRVGFQQEASGWFLRPEEPCPMI